MSESIIYHSSSRDEDIEVNKMEPHHLVNAYLKVAKELAFLKIEEMEAGNLSIETLDHKLDQILEDGHVTGDGVRMEHEVDRSKIKLLVQKSVLKAELERRGLLYLIK